MLKRFNSVDSILLGTVDPNRVTVKVAWKSVDLLERVIKIKFKFLDLEIIWPEIPWIEIVVVTKRSLTVTNHRVQSSTGDIGSA
jgi:hypothetical protein